MSIGGTFSFGSESDSDFTGGIPGLLLGGNAEPATPSSILSDSSEPEMLTPLGFARTGKKFWNDSSSWIVSRIAYQSASSSGNSSLDPPILQNITGKVSVMKEHHDPSTETSARQSKSTSAEDTIYLCNFRVSVDGDWLCLRQLEDVEVPMQRSIFETLLPSPVFLPLYDRDPTAVERSNLLNITKLVIKELIDWSIGHGHPRTLEADHPPLQHFFIVLEHALRHGLKPKKGLLGPKKELWDVLQTVEKLTNEAMDITSSIRDLPTVSTHIGRARAWLRLALMQKKLADYFKILVDHREMLKEFYEPIALMMCDDAVILSGILLGLNVIDCNFCLKEEELDSQQGVIDFSLYLRSSHSNESVEDENEQSQMDTVLDQKNYIEELNRHLNATCTNLQTRVETLTTTNALMKEDLAISKNCILSLQEDNRILKLHLAQYVGAAESEVVSDRGDSTEAFASGTNILDSIPPASQFKDSDPASPVHLNLSVTDLSKKVHEERTLRSEMEDEIKMHIAQKAEMEEAMTLLEKDIHGKQDTIISLRRQLDEIKVINLEMYKKLQECEGELHDKGKVIDRLQQKTVQIASLLQNLEAAKAFELTSPCEECEKSLKFKTDLITKLESKATLLSETIERLDEKIAVTEAELKASHEVMRSLGLEIAAKELKVSTIEGDLRIEKEMRQSYQSSHVKDKERISELNLELQRLQIVGLELEGMRKENSRLLLLCKEQENTLVDMGVRLSNETLKMEDLRESSKGFVEAQWTDDKDVKECRNCSKEFSLTRRKHHCRACGKIFCSPCSDNFMLLASSSKPVRTCDSCYTSLLQRFSAPSGGGSVPINTGNRNEDSGSENSLKGSQQR